MLTFTLLLLLFLSSFLYALPLAPRDVVSPPITSPTAGAIWNVGQTQTVTWNTAGLPVNQTNPVGMLVLGYLFNNSENLMLNSPLATNINYSTGQVQITVPNVPTRSDYIVVLFGDSGNASPQFTIINDATSSIPVPPSSAPTNTAGSNPSSPSTPTNTSPAPTTPVAGSGQPGGSSPMALATTPASQTGSPSNTTTVVIKATGASSSSSNAAWQRHVPSLPTSLSVALACVYFVFS